MRAGKINDAINGYQEALVYAKKVGSWRAITFIDSRLAAAFERLGKLPEALRAIDDAIKANQQTPREMFLVPGNMAIKARIEAEMGHRAQAERLYVKGSDILDLMLAHVPTPEMERLLLTELEDLYSGYLNCFRTIIATPKHFESSRELTGESRPRSLNSITRRRHTNPPQRKNNCRRSKSRFCARTIRKPGRKHSEGFVQIRATLKTELVRRKPPSAKFSSSSDPMNC